MDAFAKKSRQITELDIGFVDLRKEDFDPDCLSLFTQNLARRYRAIPLRFEEGRLLCATENATDQNLSQVIKFVTGYSAQLLFTDTESIDWAIDEYYFCETDDFELNDTLYSDADAQNNTDLSNEELLDLGKRMPTVRLIHSIIVKAIHSGASDIHIHPEENYVEIILRVDGSLIHTRRLDKNLLAGMISRIKIIGGMNISERRLPQDGRAKYDHGSKRVDLRISVMPTVVGESAVIRLLDTDVGLKDLSSLGLSDGDQKNMGDILTRSSGLFLVTGPTGSGKSTTLYSALQEVIKQNVNIITVENPVEYQIQGIEQIQINPLTGYDFATALRNILRHDPDVIMVGEIRDEETAKVTVESALTGHFVLSTLHTNDAVSAITRLLEIGIPPYLLASTLLGVLAQRLVRKNCPECLDIETVNPDMLEAMGLANDEIFYRGKGCSNCNDTGYRGRFAVYELFQLNEDILQEVNEETSSNDLRQVAMENGMKGLTECAIEAAKKQKTSLSEAYRVRLV